MNLFKVDFLQGKTDAADYNQVKHSLIDTVSCRQIITLSVSSDKLTSVSNYSREPRRVTFECFIDDWIQDYILSGDYEHARYISHYEIKIYRDNVLFFTGIIVTSNISYDVATNVLKITCYDKIKLLSVFSDLTHNYNITSGYLPYWIVSYFLQDISQTIPINIPFINQFSLPTLDIPIDSMLTIARIVYSDMRLLPLDNSGWTYSYHASSWTSPLNGYIFYTSINRITFIFAHKIVITASYGDGEAYQMRLRGRIYNFFNSICPIVEDYDHITGWIYDVAGLESPYNELLAFFAEKGIPQSSLNNLSSSGSLDNRSYGKSHFMNNWVEATCFGNLYPSKLHLGKGYETLQNEDTDNLKALQAMLMFYNATLYTDSYGQIILACKGTYSTIVNAIDDDDVVSFKIKRGNQEVPDMSTLDVLSGDTEQLQKLIKQHLIDFYNNKWCVDVVIDHLSKYILALQDKIQIRGVVYAINEIESDYINDEYKVKAWQL